MNLTHLNAQGHARMVDVGDKQITRRHATAEGFVRISRELADKIQSNSVAKGNLLDVARVAGIMAAKRTDSLIPMCHSLPLDGIDIEAQVVERADGPAVHLRATARVEAKTGVEMEAFTAVAVAALTVVDMGKAADPGMVIEGIRLLEKGGGKKGVWKAAGGATLRSAGISAGRDRQLPAGLNSPVKPGAPRPIPDLSSAPDLHSRGYLLHADKEGTIQFITFRLADAVPQERITEWQKELGLWQSLEHIPADDPRQAELRRRLEVYADAGHGSCALQDPRVAEMVCDAMRHFDGERYRLLAWCVMPNHVHVLLEMLPGHALSEVMHSWKSFTATQANKLLGCKGEFWMRDYFDRFMRDTRHLEDTLEYIKANPVKAGLKDWAWVGRFDAVINEVLAKAKVLEALPAEMPAVPAGKDAGVPEGGQP